MNTTDNLLRYKVCKAIGCESYSEASNYCTGLTCGWDTKMIFRILEEQGYTLVKTEEHFGCFFDLLDGDEPDECVLDTDGYCTNAKKENITDKKKCKYWQKYFLTINP